MPFGFRWWRHDSGRAAAFDDADRTDAAIDLDDAC
jgi:hypothetical protein